MGLEALRYCDQPPNECFVPPLTHHSLLLFIQTPKELEVRSEGISRVVPPRPGSILMVPAGSPARYRWSSHSDSLHVFLEPGLVERVAAETFELDSARVSVPPLDGLQHPQLRAAMLAVNDELTVEAAGGRLAAESLANLLAVPLVRNASTPSCPARRTDGVLPRGKLRAVVDYVEEHLDAGLTLEQMAAAAHLSLYHFARQFKTATGLAPHQYVISRASNGRSNSCEKTTTSRWRKSPRARLLGPEPVLPPLQALVGVTPDRFRSPQELPKGPQAAPRTRTTASTIPSRSGRMRPVRRERVAPN